MSDFGSFDYSVSSSFFLLVLVLPPALPGHDLVVSDVLRGVQARYKSDESTPILFAR